MSSHKTTLPESNSDRQRSVWWYAAGGVALTLFGLLASIVLSLPAFLIGIGTVPGFVAVTVLGEAGYVVAAVAFVAITGRGARYFDLDLPDSWRPVAVVTLAAFVFRTAVVFGAVALNVDPAPPAVAGVDLPVETLLLILLPASILVIGPAEELLFRGTIQKYLRERFSPNAAILGAGVLFASIHVLALIVSTGVGALVSLGVIFVVGLAFGWLYERTGSVVAAMAAHGVYNALIFGSGLVLTQLV